MCQYPSQCKSTTVAVQAPVTLTLKSGHTCKTRLYNDTIGEKVIQRHAQLLWVEDVCHSTRALQLIHAVYQHTWRLLSACRMSPSAVKMMASKPSGRYATYTTDTGDNSSHTWCNPHSVQTLYQATCQLLLTTNHCNLLLVSLIGALHYHPGCGMLANTDFCST